MRQVLRAGALGRPRGMGWRGRQEGGSGWGTHVNPWLIHVNVWQKPLQYCKVISLQLIKINLKKPSMSIHVATNGIASFFFMAILIIQTVLWSLASLPDIVKSVTCHCIINMRKHRLQNFSSLKNSKKL